MQLSRFVVTYRDVRPGEHVLYDVLGDRYAGVDDEAIEALGRWSGGADPLLRKDLVLRVSEALHASMRARAGRFEWSMTTNGMALDAAFARELRRFGDGFVKITLDGDKETHDRMRVKRDGGGTFDRI